MGGRYVGIDLRRRRSVIYTMDADGERLECVRIANDPWVLLEQVAKAGADAEVVIEATYGWYWAVDLLRDAGFSVHLSHPSGNDWGNRRVKNDLRDAADLADLLRLGRLAEAWIAPPAIRELRELVRYRAKLVQLRSGLKSQVHAVMAKEGVLPRLDDMFGPGGQRHLDEMQLADAYAIRVEPLRDLIEVYNREVAMLERKIHHPATRRRRLPGHPSTHRRGTHHRRDLRRRDRRRRPGSVPRKRCVRGPGSPHVTASPTPRSSAVGSPRWAAGWCAGRRSKPSPLTKAAPCSEKTSSASRSGAAQQGPRRCRPQAPHAGVLRPARRRDPLSARQRSRGSVSARTRPQASSSIGMTPSTVASRGM